MGQNPIQNDFRGYNFGIPNPVEIKLDFSKRIYYAIDTRKSNDLILAKGGYSDLRTELQSSHDFYVAKQVGAKGWHMGAAVPIALGLLGQGEWKWQKFWYSTGKAGVPFLSLRYWTDITRELGMDFQKGLTAATGTTDAADAADSLIEEGRLIVKSKGKRFKVAGGSLVRVVRGAIGTLLNMVDIGSHDYILTDQIVPNLGIEALLSLSWFEGLAGEGSSTSNAIRVTQHSAVQEELVLSPRILFYLQADRIWKHYYQLWNQKKATRPLKDIMWDLAHVYGNTWSTACTIARYQKFHAKPSDPREPRCILPLNNEFGEHFWDLSDFIGPDHPISQYLAYLGKRDPYRQRALEDAVWYDTIPKTCHPFALQRYSS